MTDHKRLGRRTLLAATMALGLLPGAGNDIPARAIADVLTTKLGQNVVFAQSFSRLASLDKSLLALPTPAFCREIVAAA